jgi:glycosyltransferase involved in cell wall biosynthesis
MELKELFSAFKILEWILAGIFLAGFFLQLAYYLLLFLKLPRYKAEKNSLSPLPVSVIICAKNEAANLDKFLPRVLEQDYPDFELIVVNDCSTDHTEELLAELSVKHPHMRFTSIPANEKFRHGKKLALTIGLKSAKHEHIVLTDADCYPASDQWLRLMASRFSPGKKIILGYGRYEQRKGLLNLLIRYETVFTAMQYLSSAIKGRAYMGVGRNLAYEKDLFFKNKGFASHYHISSGDDDLFVNETSTKENTSIEVSPGSHTISIPKSSLKSWIKQKKRHLSAGRHYSPSSRIRIAGELFSRTLVYASFIALCIISPGYLTALPILAILLIVKLVVFKLNMRCLDEKFLLLLLLLFDPILPLILGVIWFSTIFETKYQPWN